MSVYLRPCTGCPLRTNCDQRDTFRSLVKGLGLRSATFNCNQLKEAITPGTRVVIRHPIRVETEGSYDGPSYEVIYEELPATITSSGVDDFSCIIDRDALVKAMDEYGGEDADKIDTFRFRKTMKARRIVRFLDEPRRRLCDCGKPILPTGSCDRRASDLCWAALTDTTGGTR